MVPKSLLMVDRVDQRRWLCSGLPQMSPTAWFTSEHLNCLPQERPAQWSFQQFTSKPVTFALLFARHYPRLVALDSVPMLYYTTLLIYRFCCWTSGGYPLHLLTYCESVYRISSTNGFRIVAYAGFMLMISDIF